jgi:hypothetical protein
MIYETRRLSPGSTNEWKLEVYGIEASAKFSTNDPGAFSTHRAGIRSRRGAASTSATSR